ncbi:MAG: hypothetical protein KA536_15900 [Saprospiraceae bacterium]|nr:hypothetical protein [Saprospiraceae bacterium]
MEESGNINIHIEKIELHGFSQKDTNLILNSFKERLASNFKAKAHFLSYNSYKSVICSKPLYIDANMKPQEIGLKMADSITSNIID